MNSGVLVERDAFKEDEQLRKLADHYKNKMYVFDPEKKK